MTQPGADGAGHPADAAGASTGRPAACSAMSGSYIDPAKAGASVSGATNAVAA
jgi:hypothetical protein